MEATSTNWDEIHSRSIAAGYDPQALFGAKVAIVGMGALGQNVALDLALAGVGGLLLIDFDSFEPHNATRSPLYPSPSVAEKVGLGKVRSTAAVLTPLCTAPEPVIRYADSWVQAIAPPELGTADVIISAVDSQRARAYLSEFGRLYAVPVVEGGFSGSQISMTVDSGSGDDACYRCTNPVAEGSFSCTQYALAVEASNIVPAIQNAAAVLGGLMAEAAIGLLGEAGESGFRKAFGDVRSLNVRELLVSRDPACPGLHVLAPTMLDLHISSDSTLGELLESVPQVYDRIRLLEPLVVEMSCQSCGVPLRPLVPQSTWQSQPSCVECGGGQGEPYPVSEDHPFFPLEYSVFSRREVEQMKLGVVPLERLNLGTGSRVLVQSESAGDLIVSLDQVEYS